MPAEDQPIDLGTCSRRSVPSTSPEAILRKAESGVERKDQAAPHRQEEAHDLNEADDDASTFE